MPGVGGRVLDYAAGICWPVSAYSGALWPMAVHILCGPALRVACCLTGQAMADYYSGRGGVGCSGAGRTNLDFFRGQLLSATQQVADFVRLFSTRLYFAGRSEKREYRAQYLP